jgi:hypothetical protein
MQLLLLALTALCFSAAHADIFPGESKKPKKCSAKNQCLKIIKQNSSQSPCRAYTASTTSNEPTTITKTKTKQKTVTKPTYFFITPDVLTHTVTITLTDGTTTSTTTTTVDAGATRRAVNAVETKPKPASTTLPPLPVPKYAKKACKNYAHVSSACSCCTFPRLFRVVSFLSFQFLVAMSNLVDSSSGLYAHALSHSRVNRYVHNHYHGPESHCLFHNDFDSWRNPLHL